MPTSSPFRWRGARTQAASALDTCGGFNIGR
jgi:hypothetical protein